MYLSTATRLSPAARRWVSSRWRIRLGVLVLGFLVCRTFRIGPRFVYLPDWWLAKAGQSLGFNGGVIVPATNLKQVAEQIAVRETGAAENVTVSRPHRDAWVRADVWKHRAVHRSYFLREFEPDRFLITTRIYFGKPITPCVSGMKDYTDSWASCPVPSHP